MIENGSRDNLNNFLLKYQKLKLTSSLMTENELAYKLLRNDSMLTSMLQASVESSIEIIPAIIEIIKSKEPVLCAYIHGSNMLAIKSFIKGVYDDNYRNIDKLNELLFMDDQRWYDLSRIHESFNKRLGNIDLGYLSNWVADFGQPNTISLLKTNLIYGEFIKDKNLKKDAVLKIYKDMLSLNEDFKVEEAIIKHWTRNMAFDKEELRGLCKSIDEGSFISVNPPKVYHSIEFDFIKIQKDLRKINNLKDDLGTVSGYVENLVSVFKKSIDKDNKDEFFLKKDDKPAKAVVLCDSEELIKKFNDFVLVSFSEKFYEKKEKVKFLEDLLDKFNKSYTLNLILSKKDGEVVVSGRKKI